jgi:YfiH family protein
VGLGLGDDDTTVEKNRQVISHNIGEADIIYANQNHGRDVLVFDKNDTTGTAFASHTVWTGDAMISNITGKFLAIQVADCQAILMYNPVQQVVADVHAGWRGSMRNIVGRTVRLMKTHFGCDPRDTMAGIAPSLGPCCAEYRNYRQEIPKAFWRYKDDSDCFDFWSISSDQLANEGIPRANIKPSGICTKCRTDLFFSYRGEGVTGRFAAIIGLVR